jgi:YD repeat-containing protein
MGGKLQQIISRNSAQAVLQNFQYAYDRNGNIASILDYVNGSPQTQSFQYDNLDRLTSAGASGGVRGNYGPESYTYDPVTGNLASKAGVAYTYSSSHKHAVTALSSGNTYQYDANGNMTQRVANSQTYNFGYDAENHMTSVSGAATAQFAYRCNGKSRGRSKTGRQECLPTDVFPSKESFLDFGMPVKLI